MDTILVRDDEIHERCDCHVCNTLRNLFAASVGAKHDRRSSTPLLLTFVQAADLLGVSERTVRELLAEQELRAVTVQSYGRRRIPRAEIDDYVSRLLTGQLRAWVVARSDVEQWGLRYMGDRRSYTYRSGQRVERTTFRAETAPVRGSDVHQDAAWPIGLGVSRGVTWPGRLASPPSSCRVDCRSGRRRNAWASLPSDRTVCVGQSPVAPQGEIPKA